MKYFSLIFLFTLLVLPFAAGASTNPIKLNLTYPTFGGFNLNQNQDLSQIIAWFYYAIVGLSGFAAFIMIVWGGVGWMTSSGNPSKTTEAKDRIEKALLGLLLVLASFLILQVINPDFTILKTPSV